MYKLAIFDMDGTVLNSRHEISKENMQAINELEKSGVRIIIATGRPNELLKKYTNEMKVDDYVITCNGSVIGHPYKDDYLHQKTIDKDNVIKLIDMCEQNNYDYLVYTKDTIISKDNERLRFFMKFGETYKDEDKANIIQTEDADFIKNNFLPNKILILEKDPEKYKGLWEKIQDFTGIEYTQSWIGALDVSPIGETKGNAVRILCNHYDILQEEVIAFGDQLNDISMIKFAGLGIAMGNAEDKVKSVANYVTLTNDENGVADAIKKIILKEL